MSTPLTVENAFRISRHSSTCRAEADTTLIVIVKGDPMDTSQFELSRRTALGLAGAVAVTLSSMTEAFALPSTADEMKHPQR